MKAILKNNISQLIKMCMVGSIGMLVQFICFNLLRHFISPVLALQLAILFAILTNYYAHGHLTFAQGAYLLSRKGMLFVLYSVLMLVLQGEWLALGIFLIGSSPIKENIIMFLGMGWGTICNYMFYKNFIYKTYNRKKQSNNNCQKT